MQHSREGKVGVLGCPMYHGQVGLQNLLERLRKIILLIFGVTIKLRA